MNNLLERVVSTTGICELFATNAVARACERAGVDPERLSPTTLKIALPEIEKTVNTFCPSQAAQIMPRLQELARA